MTTVQERPGAQTASVREKAGTPPTRSWWGKYRNLVIALAFIAVGLIAFATLGMRMIRGGGDNVSVSPSAAAAAPSPELARLAESSAKRVEGPAPAPVTAPVAPVASVPVAPVAAEQKPAASAADESFTPGIYKVANPNATNGAEVVASFVLFSIAGKTEEALLLFAENPKDLESVSFANYLKEGAVSNPEFRGRIAREGISINWLQRHSTTLGSRTDWENVPDRVVPEPGEYLTKLGRPLDWPVTIVRTQQGAWKIRKF